MSMLVALVLLILCKMFSRDAFFLLIYFIYLIASNIAKSIVNKSDDNRVFLNQLVQCHVVILSNLEIDVLINKKKKKEIISRSIFFSTKSLVIFFSMYHC